MVLRGCTPPPFFVTGQQNLCYGLPYFHIGPDPDAFGLVYESIYGSLCMHDQLDEGTAHVQKQKRRQAYTSSEAMQCPIQLRRCFLDVSLITFRKPANTVLIDVFKLLP